MCVYMHALMCMYVRVHTCMCRVLPKKNVRCGCGSGVVCDCDLYMCVCVCVCEREKEGARKTGVGERELCGWVLVQFLGTP